MIVILISLGAVAESKPLIAPEQAYEQPAQLTTPPASAAPAKNKNWVMPRLRFDDAQDCQTYLERQIEGFGILRITHRCPEGTGQLPPWRSL